MLSSNIPVIDLHGLDRDSARSELIEFIKYQNRLGNKNIVVVHGLGTGVVKREVHNELRRNKYVSKFFLDMNNRGLGSTYVELK